MTAMLLLFVFMGVFAGYTSARLYKSFMYQASPLEPGGVHCTRSHSSSDMLIHPARAQATFPSRIRNVTQPEGADSGPVGSPTHTH